MRNFAIFGPGADPALPAIALEGATIHCAILDTVEPAFDPIERPSHVLVRKRGFSVNYRDRALMLKVALRAPAGSFYPIGSDFVGEVIAVGDAVRSLAVGDRVIGNAAYPDSGVPGVRPGVPVNSASKEVQALHEVKLSKIPDAMSDDVAACFTIGAQTSFSMVRRLRLKEGDRVLVTAGASNTSLFAIHALQRLPVRVYASTTSARHADKLRALGIADVVLIERGQPSFLDHPVVRNLVTGHGGFDAVIDPFFDIYLDAATQVMRHGGRYVTCGLADQHTHLGVGSPAPSRPKGAGVLVRAMLMNHEIIGNCVGTGADLCEAVAAHVAGRFPVLVDSTFTGDPAAFLNRSYNAADRFGKVAFLYQG